MRRLLDEHGDDEAKADTAERYKNINRCIDIINSTSPETLDSCAVKLRYLADPEIGMGTGDRDDTMSVRQVLTFIEQWVWADAHRNREISRALGLASDRRVRLARGG